MGIKLRQNHRPSLKRFGIGFLVQKTSSMMSQDCSPAGSQSFTVTGGKLTTGTRYVLCNAPFEPLCAICVYAASTFSGSEPVSMHILYSTFPQTNTREADGEHIKPQFTMLGDLPDLLPRINTCYRDAFGMRRIIPTWIST